MQSEPRANTTSALVEPAAIYFPHGGGFEAIITAVLSADVDPSAITNTALVRLEDLSALPAVALQNAEIHYDAATRTLGWRMSAPQTGPLANSHFPNAPILRFETPYRLTIDKTVPIVTTGAAFVSRDDIVLEFRTARYAGAPAAPVGATLSSELLINEVYANIDIPSSGSAPRPGSDANKDGSYDEATDEFVEIVNLTGDYLDLSGHELTEVTGSGFEDTYFTFPGSSASPSLQALLPPHAAIVVFGGQIGTPDLAAIGAGRSKLLFGNRSGNGKLNNSGGDRVRLYGPTRTPLLSDLDFRATNAPVDQSVNRDPDASPQALGATDWAPHTTVSPSGAVQSAGTRPDGTPYR